VPRSDQQGAPGNDGPPVHEVHIRSDIRHGRLCCLLASAVVHLLRAREALRAAARGGPAGRRARRGAAPRRRAAGRPGLLGRARPGRPGARRGGGALPGAVAAGLRRSLAAPVPPLSELQRRPQRRPVPGEHGLLASRRGPPGGGGVLPLPAVVRARARQGAPVPRQHGRAADPGAAARPDARVHEGGVRAAPPALRRAARAGRPGASRGGRARGRGRGRRRPQGAHPATPGPGGAGHRAGRAAEARRHGGRHARAPPPDLGARARLRRLGGPGPLRSRGPLQHVTAPPLGRSAGLAGLAVMSLKQGTLDRFAYEVDDEERQCLADWIAYFDNKFGRPVGRLSDKTHSLELRHLPLAYDRADRATPIHRAQPEEATDDDDEVE
ncbi:unnamed protein product, partial [Prorocentrum cordatum]